jgi:Flp pilus assembly pilin Flp
MGPAALGGDPLRAQAGWMRRLRRDDGQTIVEYAMLLSGVSVVLITFFIVIDLGAVFTTLVDNIEAAFS